MIEEQETKPESEAEAEEPTKKRKPASWWRKQLTMAKDEADRFRRQAQEAYGDFIYQKAEKERYKFNSSHNQHFSLFWSNIKTQQPLVYSHVPDPVVKTRNYQEDDLGRVMTLVTERLARHMLEGNRFHNAIRRVTQDFLVTGFGLPRVYYEMKEAEPEKVYLSPEMQVPPGVPMGQDELGPFALLPVAPESESVKPCFVSFDSVRFTPGAKEYNDIWWISFDNYYDKYEFSEKYGEKFKAEGKDWKELVPFNYSSRMDEEDDSNAEGEEKSGEFTRVVEIWDYRNQETLFLCEDGSSDILQVEEDILGLGNFFPCPEPAMGTIGYKTYYPTPDFIQYKNALDSLDFLENRKWRLIRALRARGIYDANQDELHKLARETSDADIVPVDNIMELIDKGGLAQLIQFIDTSAIANALLQTYQAIDQEKQKIYEISGMSDIIRGASNPNETATAQQIKGNFASKRIDEARTEISRVCRDLIEIMVDLALGKFHDDTIAQICGVQFMDQADQQLYPQALQVLRTDKLRNLRIEIETDSTIAMDEAAESEAADNLLNTMNTLFSTAVETSQVAPELLPAIRDAAMHRVRRLRKSGPLEAVIKESFDALVERVMNPQPPPEDPAVQAEQQKLQLESQKAGASAQSEAAKLQLEARKLEMEERKIALQEQEAAMNAEIEREKIAAQIQVQEMKSEIEKLKANIELMTQRFQMISEAPKVEVEREASPPISLSLNVAERGKKVGQWVETPNGRQLVVESIPDVD